MPEPVVIVEGLVKPVAARVRPGENRVFVAQRNGQILAVDLATAQLTPLTSVEGLLNTFDVTDDGTTAYVAGDTLGLWEVSLNGGASRRLARRLTQTRAVLTNAAEGGVLIAEGHNGGRLVSITIQPLQSSVIARGLRSVRGLVREKATNRLIALEAFGSGRLVEPVPAGAAPVLFSGLGTPTDLAWMDDTQQKLMVADRAGKRIIVVDLTQPNNPPLVLLSGIENLWAARPLDADRFLIGAGNRLLIGDVEREPVVLSVPKNELFIGGWVRVPVTINDAVIAFDDLDFQVEPREAAALVSASRDNSFDAAHPHILLSAGWRTGEHVLLAIHRPTGDTVAKVAFDVLDTWTDQKLGPSLAVFGSIESGPSGGTWGGPDSGDFTVPQNVAVRPALGTRNVGVVLVDTSSARYPTGAALATIINNLRNEIVNGVMVGGQLRSVATYFSQASNNLFNLNVVGIAGPIMLPNNWNSYFTFNAGDSTWVANEDLPATIIAQIVQQNVTAAQAGNAPVLDLSQMDSLVYVVRSRVSPPDPDLVVWPRASLETQTQLIGSQQFPLPFGTFDMPIWRGIARVFMPDDWAAQDGTRQFHETLAHELCHNLALGDQYAPNVANRMTSENPNQSWELMTWERDLPLPSTAHRLMLGWIKPNNVRLYNFGVFGPIDETITLHAASQGPPPAGRFAAAEVRLEDGKNYYFEYRPNTAGRIVDLNPPEASAVLATEAEFRTVMTPGRPNILLVAEDADALVDRGAFATGEDFRDQDTTSPGFANDFIVNVTNTTVDAATIRVRYAPELRPDPGLTPWSPSSNWQSPDIEVVNGRSQADATFRNIPWEGHDNTIVARVTNRGSSDAHGVKVNFFFKDFTFGGGAEQPLGDQTQDIPVGASVTFTAPVTWRPSTFSFPFGAAQFQQHACLVARIAPFLDPVSNILEVTPENNEAQSNYTWLATTTSSPATREVTTLVAENPFDEPALVYFTVHQPHPLFRTYLDHRWVFLQPGEQQRILVMVESLLGDPRFEQTVRDFPNRERQIKTTLRLSALGDTRATCTATVIGGASILAITGLGTRFDRFDEQGGLARGRVVRLDNGQGVDGKVLVSVTPRRADDRRKEFVREAQLVNGQFRVEVGDVRDSVVQGHYLGQFPCGPCDSKQLEV